jgi:hypothetical protein
MKGQVMKRPLLIAMMTASLVGGASSALAQYGTSPDTAPPANSTVIDTPGGGALYYRYDVTPSYSSGQMRDYQAGRVACEARPVLEQPACFNELNARFTFEDSTCAKFSGSALDACLHGADHGG